MRKLGILVMALVLLISMSLAVGAEDWLHEQLPPAEDYENDLGGNATFETQVTVTPFASFVTKGQRSKFPNLTLEEINPDIVQDNMMGWGLAGPSNDLVDDVENIITIDQYKWTLRANTSTQTTVETTTPEGLANNVNLFYEFSAEHEELNEPQWVRYLGANDSETFGEQQPGVETGFVMVAMDANDYLNNWTEVEDKEYNMSVTVTISEYTSGS